MFEQVLNPDVYSTTGNTFENPAAYLPGTQRNTDYMQDAYTETRSDQLERSLRLADEANWPMSPERRKEVEGELEALGYQQQMRNQARRAR